MEEVSIDDRKKELQTLLKQMEAQPSRDWTEERKRVAVLNEMIAADARAHA